MYRTFSSLRLFVAATALSLAHLAAPVVQARAGCGASVNRLSMDGEPAAPDQCAAYSFIGWYGATYAQVSWRDNSDNEDGFTIEAWAKVNGSWLQQWAIDVRANETSSIAPVARHRLNRYRVRAFNANGVSAWSNWAEIKG